jgi:DNA-binding NarL/FixJ family response regulator
VIPRTTLTERQRSVLSLVRQGYTNKEIAQRLNVSEQAAKVQVSKLLKKFGAGGRAELAVIAREGELSE